MVWSGVTIIPGQKPTLRKILEDKVTGRIERYKSNNRRWGPVADSNALGAEVDFSERLS